MELQWIKLEEKQPQIPSDNYYGDDYLVTTEDGKVMHASYVKRTLGDKEVYRWCWNEMMFPYKIIAYMPFPKPYKKI